MRVETIGDTDMKTEFLQHIKIIVGDPIGVGDGKIHAEGMDDQVEAERTAEEIQPYIRAVQPGVPGCCIDGRCAKHMLNNKEASLSLGPKTAGGPLITAYAAAEMVGWSSDDLSIADRIDAVATQLENKGILIGAHVDTSAEESLFEGGKTGCGANDRLLDIFSNLYSHRNSVEQITGELLGDSYDENTVPSDAFQSATARNVGWDARIVVGKVGDKGSGDNVEVLASIHNETHGHSERVVIFNEVEDTTFDRDAYFEKTCGKEAFCVDMWYLRKLASVMATGPNAPEQEIELLHAMVRYQAAAYITLCDGSQRPVFVTAA